MPIKEPFVENKLCANCENKCKQSAKLELLHCPNFIRKVEQLEISLSVRRKPRKKGD